MKIKYIPYSSDNDVFEIKENNNNSITINNNTYDLSNIDLSDTEDTIREQLNPDILSVQYIEGEWYLEVNRPYDISKGISWDFYDEYIELVDILDQAKEQKIKEFGEKCKELIYNGKDITLTIGKKYFSFTDEDQRNIKTLFDIAYSTNVDLPYHANGESCCLFSSQDIITLYFEMQSYITYNTTYCNMLNTMIRNCDSIDEINNIVYGQDLPEPYLTNFNNMMEHTQNVIGTLVGDTNELG